MCHMFADTTKELLKMADKLGVSRKHLQEPGTYREHFDICKSKRKLAIYFGAFQITGRQLGEILVKRLEAIRQASP